MSLKRAVFLVLEGMARMPYPPTICKDKSELLLTKFLVTSCTKNPPKRAAKQISTVKNHLFLAKLSNFRNKIAVFSFIFIS